MANSIKYDPNNINVKSIMEQLDESGALKNNPTIENMYDYEIQTEAKSIEVSETSDLKNVELKSIILFEGTLQRQRGPIGYIRYVFKRILRKGTHKYFEELAQKQTEFNEAVYTFLAKKFDYENKNEEDE